MIGAHHAASLSWVVVLPGYGYEDFLCAVCGSTLADESGCARCGWKPPDTASREEGSASAVETLARIHRIARTLKRSLYASSTVDNPVVLAKSIVGLASRFQPVRASGAGREACAIRAIPVIRSRAEVVLSRVLGRRGVVEVAPFVRELIDMSGWISPDAPATWKPGHVEWPSSLNEQQRSEPDRFIQCPYCGRRMKVQSLPKHQQKKCMRAREMRDARVAAMGPECLDL